ncbi:MAG: hypothetical protein NVSMB6_10670 [Burkholderiaceae bacterium]
MPKQAYAAEFKELAVKRLPFWRVRDLIQSFENRSVMYIAGKVETTCKGWLTT